MSRADRRKIGKRAYRRLVVGRGIGLCSLHEQGHSVATIANRLGLSTGDAQEVVQLVDKAHARIAAREAS
jgi:hypothetical protein